MLVLVDGELRVWRIKAGRVVFHTFKIVLKAELTNLYLRPFLLICPVMCIMAGLISKQQLVTQYNVTLESYIWV